MCCCRGRPSACSGADIPASAACTPALLLLLAACAVPALRAALSCMRLLKDQNTVPPSCSFDSTGMPGISACSLASAAPTTPGRSSSSSSVGFYGQHTQQQQLRCQGQALFSSLTQRLRPYARHEPHCIHHTCPSPGTAAVRCQLLASATSAVALAAQPADRTSTQAGNRHPLVDEVVLRCRMY